MVGITNAGGGTLRVGLVLLPVLCAAWVPAFAGQAEDVADLVNRVEAMQERLEAAEQELRDTKRDLLSALRQLREAQAQTREQVEQNAQATEAAVEAVEDVAEPDDQLAISGYGELHFNRLDAEDPEYDERQLDFHRFVLEFEYDFTERLRLEAELELEHALVGGDHAPGELALEQAYVEYDFTSRAHARAGVFLLPVGVLNTTHAPPTFYGVEHNEVEKEIIPASWWAGGVMLGYRLDSGVSFDLAVHEGLRMQDFAKGEARVRSGRQHTAEAFFRDPAFTGRVRYIGYPGLELAASLHYQVDAAPDSEDLDGGLLLSTHLDWRRGPFGLRALFAGWRFDARGDIERNGYDRQHGWYLEPSWRVLPNLGLFVRYADVDGGRSRAQFRQWNAGLNYWLHEDVVLKADYENRGYDKDGDRGRDRDGFNLGVGFRF